MRSNKTPITARGLSKSYGSQEVFTGVDIAVDRGTRVAILGLNGAGKTTMTSPGAFTANPDPGRSPPNTFSCVCVPALR
jgi:ABC-type multidrug transport system ATPase subunit